MENLKVESPAYKAGKYGVESLTDIELLAIMLKGSASDLEALELGRQLLSGCRAYEGLASLLHYSTEELKDLQGVGDAKAMQIQCIGELVKRTWRSNISNNRPVFRDPVSIATYYTQELRFAERENVIVAFLDFQKRLIGDEVMTTGTDRSSLVCVRDILESALKHHASSIVLIHNHPYGSATPSDADGDVTRKVSEGCRAVGIDFIDHVIIGERGFYSFRERGAL